MTEWFCVTILFLLMAVVFLVYLFLRNIMKKIWIGIFFMGSIQVILFSFPV